MSYYFDNIKPKSITTVQKPHSKPQTIEEEYENQTNEKWEPQYNIEIKPFEPKDKLFDVICPIYFFNEDKIESNINNWFKEIPIRKLYLGINNPNQKLNIDHPQVEIIDQLHLKTLGGCLVDLMKRVETDWFVYLHADVEIVEHGFDMMRFFMKDTVGIIESERIHQNGIIIKEPVDLTPNSSYERYAFRKRSYSGLQLFQKRAIEPLLEKLQDDYGYRNEDLIFQSNVEHEGFEYKKTFAMHIHQIKDHQWSTSEKITNEMQWKGLVKYSYPTNPNIRYACLEMIKYCRAERQLYDLRLHHVIQFCAQNNPDWGWYVREYWEQWEKEERDCEEEMP